MRGRKRGRGRRGIPKAGVFRGDVVAKKNGGGGEGLTENGALGSVEGGVEWKGDSSLGEEDGTPRRGCRNASVVPELEDGDSLLRSNGKARRIEERVKDGGDCLEGAEGVRVHDETCRVHLGSEEQGNIGGSACVPVEEDQRPKKKRRVSDKMKMRNGASLRRSARQAAINGSTASLNGVITSEMPPSPEADAPVEENIKKDFDRGTLTLPPSSTNVSLGDFVVLDVFSVYSCLRSFSTLLFLSPFTLEYFVEALRCDFVNPLIDWMHFSILQVLKVHLERLSEEGVESASKCLSGVDWKLLDLFTWPVYLAEYLLLHGSPMKSCFKLTELKLLEGEYYRQSAVIKLEILRCLCDDVVEAELFRSELRRRVRQGELDADNEQNTPYISRNKDSAPNELSSSPPHCDNEEKIDWNSDECCLCKLEGNLICCDGCPAAFHSRCVGVARDTLPEGDWFCPDCLMGKVDQSSRLSRPCRGAELLGIDVYGRIFLGSCGYLLVSESCDADSFHYYHKNDLSSVIEVLLASSRTLYAEIVTKICKYWDVCGDSICPTFHSHERKDKDHSYSVLCKRTTQLKENTISDSIVEKSQSAMIQMLLTSPNKCPINSASGEMEELSFQLNDQGRSHGTQVQCESSGYINYYRFGHIASSIGEEMAHTSQDLKNGQQSSAEETISSQKNLIFKKLLGFSWSVILELSLDTQNEHCGWCFSCKNSDNQDCLFNLVENGFLEGLNKPEEESKILGPKKLPFVSHSSKNMKSHIFLAMHNCLFIEDSLQGLLSGPWDHPNFRKYWRTDVLKSANITSLKPLLLALESNVRRISLSPEWVKPVDNDVIIVSASHTLINAGNGSSRKLGRRGRKSVSEGKKNNYDAGNDSVSHVATTSNIYWWRGGRLSRQLFNWKLLPRSMASKCGRQAGCQKVPGIYYPDGLEFAKRCKYVAWRVAVEKSQSVADLILHVRDLHSNIRWNELKNTQFFSSSVKEPKKQIKALKNVTIRRKHIEGNQVSYVLDFGRKKTLPEIITKQASMHQETSGGRKKYWLSESIIPLGLLKAFELKKLEQKDSKSDKNVTAVAVGERKTTDRKRLNIFSYLFSKLQNLHCICGDCNEDMLKREAVSCNFCGGFFHKKHFIIPESVTETVYMCLSCQNRETLKWVIKKPRKQAKLARRVSATKSKPLVRDGNLSRSRQKAIKSRTFKESQPQSKVTETSRNLTWYKGIRTPSHHSYWLNGLLWARKEDCKRGASFRSAKVLMPFSDARNLGPTCKLCHKQYNPDLIYLGCEDCGDWFHGVAFDNITIDTIKYINGFKCYKCRSKCPPVCPLRRGESDPLKENNAGEGFPSDTYLHVVEPINSEHQHEDNKHKIGKYSEQDIKHINSNLLTGGDTVNGRMAEAIGRVVNCEHLHEDDKPKIEEYSEQYIKHTGTYQEKYAEQDLQCVKSSIFHTGNAVYDEQMAKATKDADQCDISCNGGSLGDHFAASNVNVGASDILHSNGDGKQELLQSREFVSQDDAIDEKEAHDTASNKNIPTVGDCVEQDIEYTDCHLHHTENTEDDEQIMESIPDISEHLLYDESIPGNRFSNLATEATDHAHALYDTELPSKEKIEQVVLQNHCNLELSVGSLQDTKVNDR